MAARFYANTPTGVSDELLTAAGLTNLITATGAVANYRAISHVKTERNAAPARSECSLSDCRKPLSSSSFSVFRWAAAKLSLQIADHAVAGKSKKIFRGAWWGSAADS